MNLTDFKDRAPHGLTDALRSVARNPTWYDGFDMAGYARDYLGDPLEDGAASQRSVEAIAGAFETLLAEGAVSLATAADRPYEWDAERAPLARIVLHHSTYGRGISLPALSALELVRVYLPAYQKPARNDAPRISGKPLYSGHFDDDGHQVFYAYHWLIRQDGEALRLLADGQVGWHAGAWSVNCDSIGVCFDADLTDGVPNDAMLTAAARVIRSYADRLTIGRETVVGHRDVTDGTECPGSRFDSSDAAWRDRLVGLTRE